VRSCRLGKILTRKKRERDGGRRGFFQSHWEGGPQLATCVEAVNRSGRILERGGRRGKDTLTGRESLHREYLKRGKKKSSRSPKGKPETRDQIAVTKEPTRKIVCRGRKNGPKKKGFPLPGRKYSPREKRWDRTSLGNGPMEGAFPRSPKKGKGKRKGPRGGGGERRSCFGGKIAREEGE